MLNEKTWNDIFFFGMDMVRRNGTEKQTIKAAEELGELQQECFKALTGRRKDDKIAEEIADVLITVMQLKLAYEISSGEIQDWVKYKIEREYERIKGD